MKKIYFSPQIVDDTIYYNPAVLCTSTFITQGVNWEEDETAIENIY